MSQVNSSWPPGSFESQLRYIEQRLTQHRNELDGLTKMVIAANLDVEKMKLLFDLYSETVVHLHDTADNHEERIQALEAA